jgi:hypothetical protein
MSAENCVFLHFLISEIGAGATEMTKVSNIQMWNMKVNFDMKNIHEGHGLLNCNAVQFRESPTNLQPAFAGF